DARTAISYFDRDADTWTPTYQSDVTDPLNELNALLAHNSAEAGAHEFIEDANGNYVIKFDETTHWYECGVCGYKYMHENHISSATPDEGGNTHTVACTYVDQSEENGNTCDFVMTEPHTFTNPELARPTDNDKDGVWENGTYTYTCTCGATKEEDAVRADYTELEEAIEALEGIKNDENLTDDAKTELAEALEKAENLADDLVTAEQSQVDALVKELQNAKADIEEAINKKLGFAHITEATSGIKVQFLAETGVNAVENVQIGKAENGGFETVRMRITNGNLDLPITVKSVIADKAYIGSTKSADSAEYDTATTIGQKESIDLYIVSPADYADAGIITYTITYTIDGLKGADGKPVEFETNAYLYVKKEAVTPYHLVNEEVAWPADETSMWGFYLDATNYGDFEVVHNYKAPGTDFGNSSLVQDGAGFGDYVREQYDFENDKCYAGCSDSAWKKGDAHAATYRFYIDTSRADTYEKAGLKARFVESDSGFYDNAALKYIRLANNKAYLDKIPQGIDKAFSTTLRAGSSSNVPSMTWTATSNGDMSVSQYDNPNQNDYIFGYHRSNGINDESTAIVDFYGAIPQKTTEAKLMFSPRLEFNGPNILFAEAVTMTTHLYITSYDKAELRTAVANAEQAGFNSEYFDKEKYEAYENALKNAKEVLGKAETNQGEIDAAKDALNTAIENLNKADAEAKFILTVIHSIHENADKNSKATSTEYDYYLVNGDITPAQIDLTDMQINKKSDIANLTITEDTEYTYYYWYIDYSGVQGAIDAAEEFINNADDYSEEFIADVTAKKEALENILNGEDATTTPESQSVVNDAIKAVTDLTGHTCADKDKNHKCDTCGNKLTDCADGNNDHNCDTCGTELSDCSDGNNDHNCDVCGDKLTDCADSNNDHNCDTCGTELSDCADGNNDHKCDVCGTKLSECADVTTDKDHNCDICGAENVTEHEFVNPILTRPTKNEDGTWNSGIYTSTCNCGTTETTNIARADYEEYDAVKVALEALLENDKLTQAAKDKITAALEANKIADNYVATAEEQKLIDDAAAALNVTLGEINAGISDGSMVYVDLSAYNAAFESYNNTTKNVAKDADIETAQTAINSVAGIDATSTKANGNQDKINTATATLTALNEKYAKCAQNEHSYETETIAPTCTAQGYTTYTCKVCGHAYTSNFVDANGHAWGEWGLTTAPTKDTEGTYTRICSKGDATETKSVAREDYSAYDETVKKAEGLLKDETLTTKAKDVIQNALDKAKELDQNLPADVVVDDEIIIDNDSAEKIKNAADALEEAIKSLYDENGKLKAEYEKVNLTEYNAAVNAYESLKDKMSEADKNAVAEAMKSV
ncbi:MAG: FIVAR domain-containing protein, partial [Clostridia bacterium]|nr:FIVAR domain-containing protein [Clostridia bacterium]